MNEPNRHNHYGPLPLMRSLVVLALLFLFPSFAFSQQAFVEKLLKDINSKKMAEVKSACSPGFWEMADGDSASRFYQQVSNPRSGFESRLASLDLSPDKKRAVAFIDLWSATRQLVADQVYFYLEKQGEAWKWGGVDESREHRTAFLEGRVPATFSLLTYPSSAELKKWSHGFLDAFNAAEGWKQRASAISATVKADRRLKASDWYQFESLVSLKYKTDHWVESLQRGVVAFQGTNPDYPDYPEEVSLFLEKTPDGWKFLGTASYPNSSSILESEDE